MAEVTRILAVVEEREPRLGGRHLVCIDGPAGGGKTTLATAIADVHPDAAILHLDDLLDGWDGLPEVTSTLVRDVLAPLAHGDRASYQRYDWASARFAERIAVPPTALLVVEGVGAGSRLTCPYRTASVWVDAPSDVRRTRAVARDGPVLARQWDAWAQAEAALFGAEQSELNADLTITSFR